MKIKLYIFLKAFVLTFFIALGLIIFYGLLIECPDTGTFVKCRNIKVWG